MIFLGVTQGNLENGDPQNGDPLKSVHNDIKEFLESPRFGGPRFPDWPRVILKTGTPYKFVNIIMKRF